MSYGFNDRPVIRFDDSQLVQYSGVFDTKRGIPPAALIYDTVKPSSDALIPLRGADPTLCDIPMNKKYTDNDYYVYANFNILNGLPSNQMNLQKNFRFVEIKSNLLIDFDFIGLISLSKNIKDEFIARRNFVQMKLCCFSHLICGDNRNSYQTTLA